MRSLSSIDLPHVKPVLTAKDYLPFKAEQALREIRVTLRRNEMLESIGQQDPRWRQLCDPQ